MGARRRDGGEGPRCEAEAGTAARGVAKAAAEERERGIEEEEASAATMGVMEKLKIFAVKEPVVTASCLIAGFGLFLPAVVRPMLDSWETAKQVPPPALNDVVAGVTGKKKE